MAAKKNFTAKISQGVKNTLLVIAVLLIAFYLMTFDVVAEGVAAVLNTTPDKVKEVAYSGINLLVGAFVSITGFFILSTIPFVGAAFAIIGVAIILFEVVRMWNSRGSGTPIDIGRN